MHNSFLNQRNYRVVDEHYALIPKNDIPRSTFHRRHEHKTTGPSGCLIPILVDEVLPGDVHTGNVTIFARLSNLLFPLMDNAQFDTQFFFVPARLVWENWRKFMGEQQDPDSSISYTVPYVAYSRVLDPFSNPIFTLADYMGIPLSNIAVAPAVLHVNAMPFRAYNLIYNEWYRDENLQNSVPNNTGDGPDTNDDYVLLRRNKRHDYFTSSLPFPQKGSAVTLPLTGTAPITGIGVDTYPLFNVGPRTFGTTDGPFDFPDYAWENNPASQHIAIQIDPGTGFPQIYADLSQASGATINALRLSVATQKLLERDARGGTRYTELLRQHFGVTPQDARLQRPEYIGGGTTYMNTAAIAQTSATDVSGSTTPLGGLAGQSTIAGSHHYTMVAQEHGYIIGLASLMTRPTYQQGISRMWTRQTRYDFAWPEFTALGEQAVRNDEIYAQGTADDTLTFGYQERYAEYRFTNSRVSGLFRSTNTGTIDTWHLAQKFTTLPTLGTNFIQEAAPFARVLAGGTDVDNMQFLADILFDVKTTRPLPAYGVPGAQLGTF